MPCHFFDLLQLIPGVGTGILFSLLTSEAMEGIELNKKFKRYGLLSSNLRDWYDAFSHVIVGAINNAMNLKLPTGY